ncbi:MAG: ABC transporter ATP-binding protein [Rhodobacteraceae bacterium]|nr:ABC transporter ATP-binding protein [Paracoccaceae bacterium]
MTLTGAALGGQPVLGALRLDIAARETVAITGPSGIGKTTLLRILAGLEQRFMGSRVVPGRIAMVFQEPVLLPWRTATDNLCITTGVNAAGAALALDEVGLGGLGGRYPSELSLGQQRRLALARAFAARPELLLMDEPFVSLDAETAQEMMALFAALRARYPVTSVLVTHSREEAESLASRILTLGGQPAAITSDVQNSGAYFQLSASGVTSSRS